MQDRIRGLLFLILRSSSVVFLEHEIHILRVPGSNPGYATGQVAERFRRRIVVPVYVGSSPTLPPLWIKILLKNF